MGTRGEGETQTQALSASPTLGVSESRGAKWRNAILVSDHPRAAY